MYKQFKCSYKCSNLSNSSFNSKLFLDSSFQASQTMYKSLYLQTYLFCCSLYFIVPALLKLVLNRTTCLQHSKIVVDPFKAYCDQNYNLLRPKITKLLGPLLSKSGILQHFTSYGLNLGLLCSKISVAEGTYYDRILLT